MAMRTHRNLDVLSAAEQVVDEVNRLSDVRPRHLLFRAQLQASAQAVPANIREAFGRGSKADRDRILRIARGEAEETIGHLAANFSAKRIDTKAYWRLRNRLVTIVRMLNGLMRSL